MLWAAALRGEPCQVLGAATDPSLLPLWRWSRDADDQDEAVLLHCHGATLDIGCGPGRMTEALSLRGKAALGIDVVLEAVEQTRARGANALVRDVFMPIPGEGRWDSALLADGNVGIGGDPLRLLRRTRELLSPRGRVVVDLAPPGRRSGTRDIRLEVAGVQSTPFPWAVVTPAALHALAEAAAFEVLEVLERRGRWFASLEAAAVSPQGRRP
ncbi:MAG: class I SAM-dependent methyltransferase [Nocardioidaceae bacterium]|nr:class I SAM-dependent methyltransferase [Nocardioidaceae bacterium]